MIHSEDMVFWLERAGATLMCLRQRHPTTLMALGRYEIVREAIEVTGPVAERMALPVPDAREIRAMDTVLSWPLLVPNVAKRRLIALRSQYHPTKGRVICSWNKAAERIGCDPRSARSWHADAIRLICRALTPEQVGEVARIWPALAEAA